MRKCCLILLLAALAAAAHADAALEARLQRLAEELRCVVCQNQTLADSQAELAQDLKRELRAQLLSGASDEAVRDFMVQRYGDFVLYRPPFKPGNWALWLGPLGLLIAGVLLLGRQLRSAARTDAEEGA